MSDDAPIRPTSDVSVVVLDSVDHMVGQLLRRLDGLTDEEHLWEPVTDMWSVRTRGADSVTVDRDDNREIDPSPLTTIAWRLWHLSVDCLDDYTRRLQGDGRDVAPDADWFLAADDAVDALTASWDRYRREIAGRPDWLGELGEAWGPWAQHNIADMAMHASNELVHHGAEIALLRDLHRVR